MTENNSKTKEMRTKAPDPSLVGRVEDVTICLVKTDNDLIRKIVKKLNLDPVEGNLWVKARMRYNVWTVDQYAQITGMKVVSTITNLSKKIYINGEGKAEVALDFCYPFPGTSDGPKCIYRNEKSMNYLLSRL